MQRRSMWVWMVLVLSSASLQAQDDSAPRPPDPAAVGSDVEEPSIDGYRRAQEALFDQLRSDPSPRQQVLAGSLYLGNEDETPTALRPRRSDVVARAVQFAADDAFVQATGAATGSYASSRCGPTVWPEAEVANLLRLEPDNAVAWGYAAALAGARGDDPGADEALARMAVAPRADDHFGERVVQWRTAFATQTHSLLVPHFWKDAPPAAYALTAALQRVDMVYSSAASTLVELCKPDSGYERVWMRIGWCADAGRTLAARGSSLSLRKQGLDLLAAIGDASAQTAELQRQYDWLDTHAANPTRSFDFTAATPDKLLADWNGAKTEIAAIERTLARTGQPASAPPGWMRAPKREAVEPEEDVKAREEFVAYVAGVLDRMQSSADPREQAVGARAQEFLHRYGDADKASVSKTESPNRLVAIAEANPRDVLVQWLAASTPADSAFDPAARDRARGRLLEIDAGNAAALMLAHAGLLDDDAFAGMAKAERYDDHLFDIAHLLDKALKSTPPPASLIDYGRAHGNDEAPTSEAYSDAVASNVAMSIAYMPLKPIVDACKIKERAVACAAVGHLMIYKSNTLLNAMIGQTLLRQADALGADDTAHMRRVEWWMQNVQSAHDGTWSGLATSDEIEAARLYSDRIGKAEPPADWVAPSAKRAAAKK